MSLLLGSGSFMTRIYIPRTVFAVSALFVGLVNLVLTLIPLLIVMIVTGAPITPALAWLPLSILLLSIFTLGLSLLLSILAVQFYDVIEVYQVLLTAWFFWTPLVYPLSSVPGDQSWRMTANPMFHLIALFRAPIYEGHSPNLETLAVSVAIAVGTLVLGWGIYTSRSDELAYRL
jgi:ABC-type polysaccharide/polyol phosphate export permease